VESALGTGDTRARSERSSQIALMPWITLLALVPLSLVLVRRNVWWPIPGRRGVLALVGRRGQVGRPLPSLVRAALSLSKVK
jgi:hypothetical protein